MKAFEKWYKKQKFIYYSSSREKAWKAALEWLYDKLDYSQEHEEIKDMIEEELK